MAESFTETNKEIVKKEYPNTSETGFASVYNVPEWDKDEAQKAFSMTNIQYSYGVCEFASKELNIGHISVNFSNMFAKAHEYSCGYISENREKCNGTPKLSKLIQITGSVRSKKKFIGYSNWKPKEKNHRFLTIPTNIDLELLETLFNNHTYYPNGIDFEDDQSDTIDECFMMRPNCARSDGCQNIKECPFIVTVSMGIHNHPPPPSHKTPYNIRNQLQKIINNEHILDLTRRKFLTGTMIQNYLNGKQLSDLHPSLNNQSKIDYYIEKT
ncbi:hypothetical protein C1646_755350 [Rhizophagus diaphanus]|nr:hypothetical protein C1646_755350 [Rhizophagus diaphanus] [Rhizophagus sp. MUCL 43196]